MTELADAFVMAPGGAGSLEEFSKCIAGHKLVYIKTNRHFNLNGFFNPLQILIDHMIEEGFIDKNIKS